MRAEVPLPDTRDHSALAVSAQLVSGRPRAIDAAIAVMGPRARTLGSGSTQR
jgi:hypothetical protein